MGITFEQLKKSSPSVLQDIRQLVKQLDAKYHPLSEGDLKEMFSSSYCFLFVAKDSQTKQIVGMVTLIAYRIPYTRKALLEDLVVDGTYRRQGIATKLVEAAVLKAKEKGATSLNFTSRPSRESANKLYEKLGFTKRDSNVYRLRLW